MPKLYREMSIQFGEDEPTLHWVCTFLSRNVKNLVSVFQRANLHLCFFTLLLHNFLTLHWTWHVEAAYWSIRNSISFSWLTLHNLIFISFLLGYLFLTYSFSYGVSHHDGLHSVTSKLRRSVINANINFNFTYLIPSRSWRTIRDVCTWRRRRRIKQRDNKV
jgi:hypothetical protein